MKSAIVGCGGIANVHAQVIKKLNPQGLVAMADVDPDQAMRMASAYGATPYGDWQEMLEKEEVDVLHICTPHYLHTPMAKEALKRGIHVFMEKPPVISSEQWKSLKQAYATAKDGTRMGICFQNRYNDSVQFVKEHLNAGEYGPVLGARGFVTWRRNADYYVNSTWRGKMATEGGGALINQAIHTLDLIQFLVGEKPVSMQTVMDKQHLPETIEVEDTVAAYIIYPTVKACLYATTSYVADVPPIIEVECEKARIRIENTTVTIWNADGSRTEHDFREKERLGKAYWGTGHMGAISDFYRCVEQKTPYSIELKDVEHTVWLLLEAYRTASKRPGP